MAKLSEDQSEPPAYSAISPIFAENRRLGKKTVVTDIRAKIDLSHDPLILRVGKRKCVRLVGRQWKEEQDKLKAKRLGIPYLLEDNASQVSKE